MKPHTFLGSANLRKMIKDDYDHSCVFKLGPFNQVFCIKREPENRKKRDRCNLDIPLPVKMRKDQWDETEHSKFSV